MLNQSLVTIRDQLQNERHHAINLYRVKPRADRLLNALRRSADQALRQLLNLFPLPKGAALAAVGGFGRGELYPFSDVDLLILLPSDPSPTSEATISGLVAAMWDVGLEPGCSVRTIAQCLTEARADITVETSLLELRWIAGSRTLTQRFQAQMKEQLDPASFFKAKRSEMQQRHARHQDTPYSLEPNCKESPGGLRDLQVILWMARAAGFGSSWRQVAKAGLLTQAEARDLNRAEQAFKRLRIELHLLANRREDRLLFDLQHGLAQAYQINGSITRRASEILMQRYYWAARLVTQLNTLLVQTIGEHLFPLSSADVLPIDTHYVARQNRLDVIDECVFEKNPSELLRVFLVMQQHPELSELSARALRAIWHARHLIDASFRQDPINRRLFIEILQQEQGIVHALRRMTMLNILPRYLPVFRRVVGQMQHDLFHVYTVDQHTLAVLRNIRRFTMLEHAQEYPLATRLTAGFDRHWLLYVAALFHDIAKGRGGDHSTLGADEVRKFARAHYFEPDETELVVFLVRHHLLMSQVAQKKDLSDPQVIRDFSVLVGSTRHLTALYLLTVADIRGTSPKVWNAWKGKLLEDLFNLTLAALGGSSADANTVLRLRMDEAASLTRLAGLRDEAREAFWAELDIAYFLRHDAPEIAWHTRHLYHCYDTDETVVKARPTEGAEGLQIMVYTKHVKELFARLCGYFGCRGLSIQDARIHTSRRGYALDSFIVLPLDGHIDLRSEAALIEHELSTKLDGLNISEIKNQISARPSRLSKAFPYPASIEIKPADGDQSWILDITATDRAGLLSELAQVFLSFNISIKTAKVMTLGDRIEDIFVIKGDALTQPRTQRQFERALLDVLNQEPKRV
ncbi:[protein-PII] uridylyltransferase [Zwartia sp.]|uniref:[protein-PII] uridylyltransferase n=1 Tax=Zwartia sp. TaxID=2978004 RepID=UPI003917D2C3